MLLIVFIFFQTTKSTTVSVDVLDAEVTSSVADMVGHDFDMICDGFIIEMPDFVVKCRVIQVDFDD